MHSDLHGLDGYTKHAEAKRPASRYLIDESENGVDPRAERTSPPMWFVICACVAALAAYAAILWWLP